MNTSVGESQCEILDSPQRNGAQCLGEVTRVSDRNQKMKRIKCPRCDQETNHLLKRTYSVGGQVKAEDGEVTGTFENTSSIYVCAGCGEVTFEWQINSDDGFEFVRQFAPWEIIVPKSKSFRHLSRELHAVYIEVIYCFQQDCFVLCTMGLRALLEGVCREKGIVGKDLKDKIDGLEKFVPNPSLIEALHSFRFAGNDAAHDLQPLTKDEARLAIEVMEDLLNFLYELDHKASQMRYVSNFRTMKSGSVQ